MGGSRLERREVIDRDSPLAGHSLNQRKLKSSRQGEERMTTPTLDPTQTQSEGLVTPPEDPLFTKLLAVAKKHDRAGSTIPIRLGEISLSITANINKLLKEDPVVFAQKYKDLEYADQPWGSPYKSLIPQTHMTTNLIRKNRGFRADIKVLRGFAIAAETFATSLGQIKFDESAQSTATSAQVAHDNICILLAKTLDATPDDEKTIRTLVVTFGETIGHELSKPAKYPAKPKKNITH